MDFFSLEKGTNHVISPSDAPKVVAVSPYNEHIIPLRDDRSSNDLFRNSDSNSNLENPIETIHYFDNQTAKQIVQPIATTFPYQPHPRRSQLLQFIDFEDDNSEQHNVLQHPGFISDSELGPAGFQTSFSHSQLDTFTSNSATFEGALSPNFLDYDFDSSSFTANRKGVGRNQSVGSGLVSSDSQSKLTDYLTSPTSVNSNKVQFGVISRPSSAMSSHAPPSGFSSNSNINMYSVGQRPPIPSPRAYSVDQDADIRHNISQSMLDHNSYHSHSVPPSQRPQNPQQHMQGQKLSVEDIVTNSCREILTDAADHALKAVELANTLRARIGTEMLAQIRERWGGLLALLERYQTLFRVDRIPKNDKVTLICSIGTNQLPSSSAHSLASAIGAQPHSTPVSWSTHASHRGPSPRPNPTHGNINMRSSSRQSGSSSVSGYSLSPSPDSAAAADAASYFSSMFHSQEGDIQNSEHGSGYLSSQQASRCLHVGNVPLNITEVQLMREFEKFGQLDGLKLISQRSGGRRFAFITFYTIEQAITAKHCLSKIHPWKSAISFAHRDFNHSSATSSAKGHLFHPQAQLPHSAHYSQHQRAHILTPTPSLGKEESGVYSSSSQLQQGSWSSDSGNDLNGSPFVSSDFPALNVDRVKGVATPPVETRSGRPSHTNQSHEESDVLRRLCDDTYVPTQPWPINCERDKPYCFAVIAQLQQFGGCTTVSKLRGFLRNRIAASDNIKSVPLKAMLAAYPHFFIVQNNYVSLQPGLVSPTESATSGN